MDSINWDEVEGGDKIFDFGCRSNEIQSALVNLRSPVRVRAIQEIARVYSRYREVITGEPFRWTSAPGHRKMLEPAGPAALMIYQGKIGPTHVLRYLHRPGGTSFAGNLSFVPWNMYTSSRMIDQAASWQPPQAKTHAFAAKSQNQGAALRARLIEQFGEEAVNKISSDDDALWKLIGMRAAHLKSTPGAHVPSSVRAMVEWEAERVD